MAQPRRLRARAAVMYRGQGKQASGLDRVLDPPRQATELGSAEVGTKSDCAWHGERPRITMVNHVAAVSGNPSRESHVASFGIIDAAAPFWGIGRCFGASGGRLVGMLRFPGG